MQQPGASTPAATSRAVQLESFGGPEVLNLREVPAPQAGSGQIRVRVTAAGLNPMDWFMTSDAETATRFGLSLPSGFGTDYAGVVDQVGDGVTEFAAGDRVFGGALSRAVADYVVIDVAGTIAAGGDAHHTPDGVDDRTAATLAIGGCTAAAALAVVKPGPGDTLLIGGAGGGVGVFAVQLARLAGARVIGTGSATSADTLRALGAEPVAYGDGLAGRLRALAPGGVTAAIDLYGTDTAQAARELSVPDERITTIAAQVDGITPANGANAAPGAIEEIARLVAAGQLRVPIAASFPVGQIRAAVELQPAGTCTARSSSTSSRSPPDTRQGVLPRLLRASRRQRPCLLSVRGSRSRDPCRRPSVPIRPHRSQLRPAEPAGNPRTAAGRWIYRRGRGYQGPRLLHVALRLRSQRRAA